MYIIYIDIHIYYIFLFFLTEFFFFFQKKVFRKATILTKKVTWMILTMTKSLASDLFGNISRQSSNQIFLQSCYSAPMREVWVFNFLRKFDNPK